MKKMGNRFIFFLIFLMIVNTTIKSEINTIDIADSAVTKPKIKDGAVSEFKLATDAVTTTKIANTAVTGAKIADNAITNQHIQDNTISEQKLDQGVIGKLNQQGGGGGGFTAHTNNPNAFGDQGEVGYLEYYPAGRVLSWGKNGFVRWRSILPCEGTLDMKGGQLELESDIEFKGGGGFETLGTVRSFFTSFNSGGSSERSIILSDQETVFPHGVAAFIVEGDQKQSDIPTMAIESPVVSHIPVSLDWTDPFPKEHVISVSNGGSGAGIIRATEVEDGQSLTLTEQGRVTTENGEGKFTSVRVMPFVDPEKGEYFIAVSRLAAGANKSSLLLYRYNPFNDNVESRFTVQPIQSVGVDIFGTPDFKNIAETVLPNRDVYAVAWRPNFGAPGGGHQGPGSGPQGPGGGPQLAVAYKGSDALYYLSLYELFFDGFSGKLQFRERGKVQLQARNGDGKLIADSGEPVLDGLSWTQDGQKIATIVQDASLNNGESNNIQVFEVFPDGRFATEPLLELVDGITRPKFNPATGRPFEISRVIYAIYTRATKLSVNPTDPFNPLIAVAAPKDSDSLRIYKLDFGTPDQFGFVRQVLTKVKQDEQDSPISLSGVDSTHPVNAMHWDNRGRTLVVAISDSDPATESYGGIRLVTVNRQGVKTGDILSDAATEGSAYAVRYNRLGEKFARGSVNSDKTRLGVHKVQFAGGKGQEIIFEDVKLVLKSDITFNTALRVGVDFDQREGNINIQDKVDRVRRFIIVGNGHTMTFTDEARVIIPGNSALVLDNVVVKGIKSRDQVIDNVQEFAVVSSIDMQSPESRLYLQNAQLIPETSGAQIYRGKVFLVGDKAQLGGDGKTIILKKADAAGQGGVTLNFDVEKFSGKGNIKGAVNVGKTFAMQGDMDFRGSAFTNPTNIDGGGGTMRMNARSYPALGTLNIDRENLIPSPQAATGDDSFGGDVGRVVNSIDTTADVELPFVATASTGDGANVAGKVDIGILNPKSQKMVKGASLGGLTGANGKVKDVTFKKGSPLEVKVGSETYDRHFVAVLQEDASDKADVKIHAVDVNQKFYTEDIFADDPAAADYEKIRTASADANSRNRVTTLAPGEGTGTAKHSSDAKITFKSNEKAKAVAMSPKGKELAVVVETTPTQGDKTYETRVYPVLDDGTIITDTTKISTVACSEPSTKNKPLKWSADGKVLNLSGVRQGGGKLQTFVKKDTGFTKATDTNLDYVPAIAPHPQDPKKLAVTEDGVAASARKGIKIWDIDETGKAAENKNAVVAMPGVTVNDVKWHPDGNMVVVATDKGVKATQFNSTDNKFDALLEGDIRFDKDSDVKTVQFTPAGTGLIRHGQNSSNQDDLVVQVMPEKDRGGMKSVTMEVENDLALAAKVDVTSNSQMNLNKKTLEIPSTGEIKVASGVTLTLKGAKIKGVKTARKAIAVTDADGNPTGEKKVVNKIANIKLEDSTSKIVLDDCEMELDHDAAFVEAGQIEVKTNNVEVRGAALSIPSAGQTKVTSPEGYTLVPDSTTDSVVTIDSTQLDIAVDKLQADAGKSEQKIRAGTNAQISVAAAQRIGEGQQLIKTFERSTDATRAPLTLTGSDDADNPKVYKMDKDYAQIIGSGDGDIVVEGHVRIEGPTTKETGSQKSKSENTGIKVQDGATLTVKTGGSLTVTGRMSVEAGKNGKVVVQDNAAINFGTETTAASTEVGLKASSGGEIKTEGANAKINLAYGENRVDLQPGSTMDFSAGGKMNINMTGEGVLTDDSTLTKFSVDKAKIVGKPSGTDPMIVAGPNKITNNVEAKGEVKIKGAQATGNASFAFHNGTKQLPPATITATYDLAETAAVGDMVEHVTQDFSQLASESDKVIRSDLDGKMFAESADHSFEYTIKSGDKKETYRRVTENGVEKLVGQNGKGQISVQVKGQARVN